MDESRNIRDNASSGQAGAGASPPLPLEGMECIEAVLDFIGDGVSIQDRNFRILYQNRAHSDLIGEHLGEHCFEAYEQRNQACEGCPVALVFKDGKVHTVERSAPTKAGMVYVEITASPLRNKRGEVVAGIEVVRDITERKLSAEKLRQSEEKNRTLLNAVPDAIFRLRSDGTFLDHRASKDFEAAPVAEISAGTRIEQAMPPDVAEEITHYMNRALETGMTQTFHYQFLKEGAPRHFEARVVKSAEDEVLAIVRDVTRHRELEDQLRQAQKMETLGHLTSGLAHEFNNIMTAIMGFGELLQDEMDKDAPLREYVDLIVSLTDRASKLTSGLLAYGRKEAVRMEPVDLNELVRSIEPVIGKMTPENISLKVLPHAGKLTVLADRNQIDQILMNLSKNAIDAMPDGGSLTIRSEPVEFYRGFSAHDAHIAAGTYALILVTDTGKGIGKIDQKRIFEPFFTTKVNGTGLGLPMVHGIVKRHNGYVHVDSEPDKGTTVMIYLPISSEKPLKRERAADAASQPGPSAGTLLLAEDDEPVRRLMKNVLERAGYTVIEAKDGRDAVEKFLSNRDSINLMIFDVALPKRSGFDAYGEIAANAPDAKIIFISGYLPNDPRTNRIVEEGHVFLSKPVEMRDLLKMVQKALGD